MFLLASPRIVRGIKFVWKVSAFGLSSWRKVKGKVHTAAHTGCRILIHKPAGKRPLRKRR